MKRQELRAAKFLDGICNDCADPVEIAKDGTPYTRCRAHRLLNNRLSAASHSA